MIRYFVAFVLICTCISCNHASENATIFKKVLEIRQLKKNLHTEIQDRNPYYLLENDFVNTTDTLSIYGIPILIKKKSNIKNENYFEINKFGKNGNKASISIYYKIENISIPAELKKRNGEWDVEDFGIVQY